MVFVLSQKRTCDIKLLHQGWAYICNLQLKERLPYISYRAFKIKIFSFAFIVFQLSFEFWHKMDSRSSASASNSSDSSNHEQSSPNLKLVNEHFKYDPEITDLTLIVENQKFHVSKVVLIDASPVFRKKLTEKYMTEFDLPGKKYSSFELFLRCIFPGEYYTLTGRKYP